ncbi:unnamed protein product [Phaeothamnion confervicola]
MDGASAVPRVEEMKVMKVLRRWLRLKNQPCIQITAFAFFSEVLRCSAVSLSGIESWTLEYVYYQGRNVFQHPFPEVTMSPVITKTIAVTSTSNITSAQVNVTAISSNTLLGTLAYDTNLSGAVDGIYDEDAGTLWINGSAPAFVYQTLLRSVTYEAPDKYSNGDDPRSHMKEVSFVVTDSSWASSAKVTREILLRTAAKVCTDKATCAIMYPRTT